ncbi:hypothetical protein [Litorihabitans aurantiacus]|uniref:DUF4230 domain-containing protein n=1 Tax=Litorihabitans aurantiacus TaxID=1930061 RepID=A0AA37XIN2_9MICO|nr:hypothetical protein [Litorihabitans aurantiacus]GMA33200.1 hypothetical protein GCM10025875_31920 [Litorihabitans aurantiacus]
MTTRSQAGSRPWLGWLGWLAAAVLTILLVLTLTGRFDLSAPTVTTDRVTRDVSVLDAVETEEQVVLLTLGIQGLLEESSTGEVLGITIPGSARSSFMRYEFSALAGIEGEDVAIEETGEGEYLITIPEFVLIGHDDESFELVVENNGVLSFVTPEIDEVEMVGTILDGGVEQEYLDSNDELLREQAMAFYRGIVSGIDPDAAVAFEFAEGAGGRD